MDAARNAVRTAVADITRESDAAYNAGRQFTCRCLVIEFHGVQRVAAALGVPVPDNADEHLYTNWQRVLDTDA